MRIITTAPVPRPAQWPAIVTGPAADDDTLAQPWLLEGDRALWFSRATWALRAIVDGLTEQLGRLPELWLPDYFCNQPTQPLRQVGLRPTFYPIDGSLQPDWARCEALSGSRTPDLFVLVHYFGVPVETGEARAFCNRLGAALIEDAAHLMTRAATAGTDGDFVLYSQYKHLPVPDGGLLVVRPSVQEGMPAIVQAARRLSGTPPNTLRWMAKRLIQSVSPALASVLSGSQPGSFDDDPGADGLPPEGALSNAARRLIAVQSGDLFRMAERRRANERRLRDLFRDAADLKPLFPEIDSQAVPYRAVFRASDHEAAQRRYDRIRASGNVVETWPDLPPEVKADPDRHAVAIALRNTLLGLPIHADRTPEALEAA